jgi:hypothetical protein
MGMGIAMMYMAQEPEPPPRNLSQRLLDVETPGLKVAQVLRKGAHQPEHVRRFCALVREHLAER